MARQLSDGTICIRGLGTPLSAVAINLAIVGLGRRIWSIATEGGYVASGPITSSFAGPLGPGRRRLVSFPELILEIVPRYQPHEFMRPAQLDARGRSNNVRINRPGAPLLLPGCGGIADATSVNGNLIYYLPRHDTRTLVPEVDFCSGAGRSASHGQLPVTPRWVVTELCVLKWEDDQATVESIHPGVTVDDVVENTGFQPAIPHDVMTSAPPTEIERAALAEVDPDRHRDLEFEGGATRLELLRAATLNGDRS
jgi:acyl CoA:acetate/3-ketoacid CoA transferase beta subunit